MSKETPNKEVNRDLVEQWERIKTIVASLEDDVLKLSRGNVSAGIRGRKGLRALKSEASTLVKGSIVDLKRRRAERK